jgi:hypothetical protein
VAPAALVVAVGQLEIPHADVGAAHRQLQAGVRLTQLLFHLPATGDVEKAADAATDTVRSILEWTDVAEQFAAAAVGPHDVHLEIPNLNTPASDLHGHLVGRQFFAVPQDPMVIRPLLGRSIERGVLSERHARYFAQVGVVRDAPAIRIVGNANPDRHNVQNRLHLIDPAPQLLIEAPNLLSQASPTLLALPQPLLVLQPFEFGRCTGGEDAKDKQLAWLGRHRPLIENRQVAEMPSLRVNERHAQVALDAPAHAQLVSREPLAHTSRVVTKVAAHHVLARRAGHVPLNVVGDSVLGPERQGARPRAAGKHGHEGVVPTDGRGQMLDEGLKEFLPAVARGPLDDGVQGG